MPTGVAEIHVARPDHFPKNRPQGVNGYLEIRIRPARFLTRGLAPLPRQNGSTTLRHLPDEFSVALVQAADPFPSMRTVELRSGAIPELVSQDERLVLRICRFSCEPAKPERRLMGRRGEASSWRRQPRCELVFLVVPSMIFLRPRLFQERIAGSYCAQRKRSLPGNSSALPLRL
jgi:hypothetical protein